MKKLIFFLIIIFAGLSAFGQLDTTNIGTGANTGTGESIRSAFLKVNLAIKQVNVNTDSLKLKLNKIDTLSLSNRIDAMSSMTYPASGIALSTGSAWGSSITNNSTNWNTAYTDRLKWDGGSTGLTAATGRTSLGGTTVGQALFTLTNPSAITFLRINADNSVTALSATNFKTALSLTASDVGLGNVTNESKATMFTNPTFTGVQKVSTTDTLATRAYARSVSGSGGAYLEVADTSTMLNKYARKASPTFTGVVTVPEGFYLGSSTMNASAAELNVLNGIAGGLTSTELSYVDGVTDYIQDQIDSLWQTMNDTIRGGTIFRELADTLNYSFQVGLGLAGDTACFRKAYILASFNSLVSDTIVVDSVNYVAVGTSPDVDVQMYFDANFNDATPTAVCTSSVTVTSTTTGNGTTSFSNAQIPPGKKVWFKLTENTTQPKVLSGTVFYHVINRSY